MTSKKDARKTRLRQRMIDQMRMAGLARNTQTSYVREIKCLAEAFNMSPDRLEPEQVRSWHLGRIDRGLSENTTNVGLAALKFFYRDTLHQPRMIDGLRMRKVPRGLPRAMSEEEIERLLMATPDLRYRTSMTLTYACGLRISETVAVTIDDVKSCCISRCAVERFHHCFDVEFFCFSALFRFFGLHRSAHSATSDVGRFLSRWLQGALPPLRDGVLST